MVLLHAEWFNLRQFCALHIATLMILVRVISSTVEIVSNSMKKDPLKP